VPLAGVWTFLTGRSLFAFWRSWSWRRDKFWSFRTSWRSSLSSGDLSCCCFFRIYLRMSFTQQVKLRLNHLITHKILWFIEINKIEPLIIHVEPFLNLFICDQTPSLPLIGLRKQVHWFLLLMSFAAIYQRKWALFPVLCEGSTKISFWLDVWSSDFSFWIFKRNW